MKKIRIRMRLMDSKNKAEELIDTKILERFTLEQLTILKQQINWEIEERVREL